MKIEFCWRQIFEILIIHKTGVTRGPKKKLSPIGSAVSTFKIQANNPTSWFKKDMFKYQNTKNNEK